MPCPICTGALISSVAQGAALMGVVKHVNDKQKSKNKKSKSKSNPSNK